MLTLHRPRVVNDDTIDHALSMTMSFVCDVSSLLQTEKKRKCLQKKRGNLGRCTPIAKARRVSRTDETEEEADARRESARLRIAEVRQAETPDETERRLETARVRIAELRSSEKLGERARRLETKRARFTETISEVSSDQKERRLQVNRLRIANARNARFTNWENSAFSYSPTIRYQTQPLTQIGSMTEICQSCSYRPICYWSVVFALIYPAKRVIPTSL